MSKNDDTKLGPKIRFPEFVNAGEWAKKKLGEIGEFTGGGTPSRGNESFWKGDIPWISSSDIDEESIYSLRINRFISEEALRISATKRVPGNSILLVSRVGVGKLAITNKPICTSQDFTNFTPYNQDIIFLAYCLKSHKQDLLGFSQGMAIKGFTKEDISKLNIQIPSIKEQQKIAACLSSLDEVITAESQKLEIIQDHKKGLLRNLLPQEGERVPKFRFKEFEYSGEWVDTSIEKNCLVKGRIGYRGYTTEDLVEKDKGALVLGGKHIQNQAIDLSKPTFLSWDKYYESPEIMVEIGDIIFSQRGTLGDCAIIEKEIGPATINPSMVLLKNITCNSKFLYYILIGFSIQKEIQNNRALGAIPMLSQKQIREFPFLIPRDPKEQKKIADTLSSIDDLTAAQNQKLEALQLHKEGLLQGLFPNLNEETE